MITENCPQGIRVDQAKYGLGVYATKPFMPEEFLGRVTGQLISDPNHESDYCIDLNEEFSLEPAAPFRFLNHSCQPNCLLVHFEANPTDGIDQDEIWVETIRPVQPGEQLTIDYSWPAEVAIPCGCESDQCRGWIVAPEQRHEIVDERPVDLADGESEPAEQPVAVA